MHFADARGVASVMPKHRTRKTNPSGVLSRVLEILELATTEGGSKRSADGEVKSTKPSTPLEVLLAHPDFGVWDSPGGRGLTEALLDAMHHLILDEEDTMLEPFANTVSTEGMQRMRKESERLTPSAPDDDDDDDVDSDEAEA